MDENIRIRDIAEMAGVSVGTVDRVLHNRPNVSPSAMAKVQAVLKQIDYKPNKYARALANNKKYIFYCIIPKHESETYWEEIEEGARAASIFRREFHVHVKILHYTRFDADDFNRVCQECLAAEPQGVVLVPSLKNETSRFADALHQQDIPMILLDSYVPELKPLSFYGQDSYCSGYFAAKILMLVAAQERGVMLMRRTNNGEVVSVQQKNRENGFKNYMTEHQPNTAIHELELPLDADANECDSRIDTFFAEHPDVHHCITLSSEGHIVGEYLQRTHRTGVQIMGYDMVSRNARCLRLGTISFLIAQHAYMQGYNCVDTLFKAIVLKDEVEPVNFMPIELLSKENIDFYRRKQL